VVRVLAAEMEYLCRVADHRNGPKIGVVRNRRVDRRHGDLELNVLGVIGEYVTARYLGTHLDDRARLDGDGGVTDLHWRGWQLQVKTNQYPHGELYFNTVDDFKADFGVLVVPEGEDTWRMAGWIDRAEFRRRAQPRDWGYGERASVPRTALRPMAELWTLPRGTRPPL
jgi:hypothetical protein